MLAKCHSRFVILVILGLMITAWALFIPLPAVGQSSLLMRSGPTPVTSTRAPLTPPVPLDSRVLSLQSPPFAGEDVRQLQEKLAALGYREAGDPTGTFDAATDAAVRHFQSRNGLAVDGVVNTQTWERLMSRSARPYALLPPFPGHNLSLKSTLPLCDDQALHSRLAALGYLSPTSEEWQQGTFGPETNAAVQQFQRANGLPSNGIVTLQVWEQLFGDLAAPAGLAGTATPSPAEVSWISTIFPVNDHPLALAFDGQRLWVAHSDGTLLAIDPAANRVGAPINLNACPRVEANITAENMVFAGKQLWVISPDSMGGRVEAISPATGIVSAPIQVGECPPACFPSSALGFDGKRLWAAVGDDTVRAIDPITGRRGVLVKVDWLPTSMFFDGKWMWVSTGEGVLYAFDPNNGKYRDNSSGDLPGGRALTFDGARTWFIAAGMDMVIAVDRKTGQVGDFITVGSNPSALTFDGKYVWVASQGDNTVQAIDSLTGQMSEPIPVGHGPGALAFDGTRLWIANTDGDTVQYIDPTVARFPTTTGIQ